MLLGSLAQNCPSGLPDCIQYRANRHPSVLRLALPPSGAVSAPRRGCRPVLPPQAEAALRQALAESGERGFAQYLRDSNSGVKGVAVSDPQKIGDLEVKVRVEYIYQDRNQAQMAYIENGPGGWRISRTEGDERVRALVPYGRPVK